MACKDSALDGFREDAAAGKDFATRYYNASIHRAARALPELLGQAPRWMPITPTRRGVESRIPSSV